MRETFRLYGYWRRMRTTVEQQHLELVVGVDDEDEKGRRRGLVVVVVVAVDLLDENELDG